MLQLTFNPRLTLTGFRTTRPCRPMKARVPSQLFYQTPFITFLSFLQIVDLILTRTHELSAQQVKLVSTQWSVLCNYPLRHFQERTRYSELILQYLEETFKQQAEENETKIMNFYEFSCLSSSSRPQDFGRSFFSRGFLSRHPRRTKRNTDYSQSNIVLLYQYMFQTNTE